MFDQCETRQCANISIVLQKSTKSSFVTLERTPDLDPRITLNATVGEIVITDGWLYIYIIYIVYIRERGGGREGGREAHTHTVTIFIPQLCLFPRENLSCTDVGIRT